jgi:2-oxo-4-hydroxy-4-carboxy-5-ureidoimidazoline decarboxylase
MTVTLQELNSLSANEAAELFQSCCGSTEWVKAMIARRPYDSEMRLLMTADDVWNSLKPDDWREAFRHHPPIGGKKAAVEQSARAQEWSKGEQAQVNVASSSIHDQMSLVNRAYEAKFGYIFIVSASGKAGDDILEGARKRLRNDADRELNVASEEQKKITRLRLQKLLGHDAT